MHAAAGGAVVLAGLNLAAPGVVEAGDAVEAAAQAVVLGLAALRVPLESGDVHGTFAPLSALLLTVWGLGSAVRRSGGRWAGPRVHIVAATGAAFSMTCAGAAAAAGALTTLDASVPGAAIAGLGWGAAAAWLATARFGKAPRGLEPIGKRTRGSEPMGRRAAALRALTTAGPPEVSSGLGAAALALGLGGAWFLAAAALAIFGVPVRELLGGLLLAIAFAPNAAAAVVAVGLGASVDAVLAGTALAEPVRESLSLGDWAGGGIAPPHVLVVALAPLVATIAAGRVAAMAAPNTPTILRGLRAGAVLGGLVVLAGWAGSLSAAATGSGEQVSVRLGFPALTTFGLALAWGVAGAYVGPLLPWPIRGGRRSRVSAS